MKFVAVLCLAPLILAGCMPTEEGLSDSLAPGANARNSTDVVDDKGSAAVLASTFKAPAFAPTPPPRPDFEGVTPASRALGAVVADAEEVDRKLEENAAKPEPRAEQVEAAVTTVALTTDTPAPAATPAEVKKPANSPGYYAAYDDTVISCFPQTLREALNLIADHYGKAVEVTSGMRNRGRRHSLHRSCSAADIRVAGVSPGTLATFAKSVDGINGVGTYRYNDVTHVDVRQEKMAWRY